MGGTLTIHSSGTGETLSGHSWIEFTPDNGGESVTYGTWGNDPGGKGNGLHRDLEKGRTSDASRSMKINDEQQAALFKKVSEYDRKGEDGWGYLSPCSTFAEDAWSTATGEHLEHRAGPISNPSRLKRSIEEANARDGGSELKPHAESERPKVAQQPLNTPVDPCKKE